MLTLTPQAVGNEVITNRTLRELLDDSKRMSSVDIRTYLAAGETLRRRWTGTLRDGGIETGVVCATDRRLLFCSDAGTFWDVAYDHVSAVESRSSTRTTIEGLDYRALVGGGATLSVVGFVGAIGASSGFLALALVVLLVCGLVIAEHGWKHRDEYDGFVRHTQPLQRVTLSTTAGQHFSVEVFTTESLGADLGTLVRASGRSTTDGSQSTVGSDQTTIDGGQSTVDGSQSTVSSDRSTIDGGQSTPEPIGNQ